MLIKQNKERVTVGSKGVGEKVNIEVDMVGKYVEKSVIAALGGSESGNPSIKLLVRKVVEDVLKEKGIIH